ncbi:MAG: carboxypeptidase-like regulatory domain-containing protein [Sandaracinaceae bacterium]|nr:carboxypeptidase-like regulatory domain-containing protein [Sandaracinaceae bacterium]
MPPPLLAGEHGATVPDVRALAIATCAVLAGWSTGAHAQPTVRVRAQTRLELQVGRTEGGVAVTGTLRDDLGEPLPDRAIELRVRDEAGQSRGMRRAATDAAGRVTASFPLETGSYRVTARWSGDDGHDAVEVQQPVDLDRAYVRLSVVVGHGGRLDLDAPSHEVEVTATSAEGGAGLVVEVRDELDAELARATTDARGAARLSLASRALGPPAAGRLVVRTAGDARRARAQTEVPVVRFRTTSIAMSAAPRRVTRGERVEIEGRLFDSQGPLARRAVGVFADEIHLATVLTDDDGRFAPALELEGEGRRERPHGALRERRAVADVRDVRAAARRRRGAGSTPWPWLLGSMIACAIVVSLLSRRPRALPALASEPSEEAARPGILTARAVSRGAQRRDVAGRVLDADEGTPVAGARIGLRDGSGGAVETTADAEGRFAIERVDGGGVDLRGLGRGLPAERGRAAPAAPRAVERGQRAAREPPAGRAPPLPSAGRRARSPAQVVGLLDAARALRSGPRVAPAGRSRR